VFWSNTASMLGENDLFIVTTVAYDTTKDEMNGLYAIRRGYNMER
jgi:hypothetical protein